MIFRKIRVLLRLNSPTFSTSVQNVPQNVTNLIPTSDIETKLLKVAIIGVPNVGKSTLINNLMDRKVCATSSKVHTTRGKARAIFTEGDSQIVFLDTPGLVSFKETRKYNLERSFLKDSKMSLGESDVIGVIHDASNSWTRDRLDIKVIKLLEDFKNKPSFLVLNKVDVLKSKRKLLDITRLVTENCINGHPISGSKQFTPKDDNAEDRGWPYFGEVFMVSALTGSGLDEVRDHLIKSAKPGKWMFPPQVWSDKTAEDLIVENVKGKLLDFIPQEIPYQLKPEMEFFDVNEAGAITTVVLVHCPSERISKLVAGSSNGKLRQINESVQKDLQDTFQTYVRIKIVLVNDDK